jgi:hypothetical protein
MHSVALFTVQSQSRVLLQSACKHMAIALLAATRGAQTFLKRLGVTRMLGQLSALTSVKQSGRMATATQNPDGCGEQHCGTVLSSAQLFRHAHPCKAVTVGLGETLSNNDRKSLEICFMDAWKASRCHLNKQHRRKDTEMKDFASPLAHDALHNGFNNLRAEDGALAIDSRRGERQLLMCSRKEQQQRESILNQWCVRPPQQERRARSWQQQRPEEERLQNIASQNTHRERRRIPPKLMGRGRGAQFQFVPRNLNGIARFMEQLTAFPIIKVKSERTQKRMNRRLVVAFQNDVGVIGVLGKP